MKENITDTSVKTVVWLMDDETLNVWERQIRLEKSRRKLTAYNERLYALMKEAEAEGIRFIYDNGEDWCVTLTPDCCEAAC